MTKTNKLVHQMDKAIEMNDHNAINRLCSQITEIIPDDFNAYKSWFEYLITNYELYIEKLEKIFLHAIKKCKEAEQVCDKKYLGSLYLYEYKLIDILTSDYHSYFDTYNGDYLLGLLNKVISLHPDNIEAYEIRSNIFLTIGQEELAKEDIEMQEKLRGILQMHIYSLILR